MKKQRKKTKSSRNAEKCNLPKPDEVIEILDPMFSFPPELAFDQSPCTGACTGSAVVRVFLRDFLGDLTWVEVPLETKIQIARAMQEFAADNETELKSKAKRIADLRCSMGADENCPCGGGGYRPICGYDSKLGGSYGSGWRYIGRCTNLF